MVAEHITNLPCDKHSGKRAHTQMLVVHSIESPLANGYAVSMAKNWLGKWYDGNGALIEASSNVIVSPDTLVRSVHTDYAAWHASWANSLSVGYEQAGYAAFTRAQWLTGLGKIQIDRLAREMALDAELYGIPLVWLTRAQVNAIAAGDRTIKGLVTHAVIDPVNRADPGSQYPYDVLLASIREYASGSTKPQGTKPAPIQEDDLTAKEVTEIKDHINAVLLGGYSWGGKKHVGIGAVVEENQRRIGAIPAKVWATTVSRGNGKKISALQELADAKTESIKANATLIALQTVIGQLAGGSAVDYAKVTEAVTKALAEGVVKVDVAVAGVE